MNRHEFETILEKTQAKYNLEDCPDTTREMYWNRYKDMTPEKFEKGLDLQYSKMLALCDSEEVREIKKNVADLVIKLLTTDEGLYVLSEMNEFFDLEIQIDQSLIDDATELAKTLGKFKNSSRNYARPDNSDKCPDKLTPDILKILKGGKDG